MPARKTDDAGQAEVAKQVEKIDEQGFIGQKVDPLPDSAHSLESGPDAPAPVEDDRSRSPQPTTSTE